MKLVRVAAVVVAGGLLLSACGGQSDEERARDFAIKACDIPTDDGGEPVKNDEGVVEFDASRDPSAGMDLATDPISDFESLYDRLVKQGTNSQAAAQLDPTWRSLADALTQMSDSTYTVLSLRKKGMNPYDNADMMNDAKAYNASNLEWASQCSGLAALLSE